MRPLLLASVVVLVSCNGLVSALDGGPLPPPGDELSGRTADGGFSNGGGAATGGGAAAGGTAMGGGSATGGGSVTGGGVASGGGSSSLDLDQPLTPGSAGMADVTLEVRSNRGRHAISPLIYGTNQPANPMRNRYGLLRLGGNRLTAFNWENNASNAGSDYQFQNDNYLSSSNVAGALLTDRLTAARAISAAVIGCTAAPSRTFWRPSTTIRSPAARPSSMIQSLPTRAPTLTCRCDTLLPASTTQTK